MTRKNGSTDKKILILNALGHCLQHKPFDQTSIKDIAQAAGVNHGLLHYYFKSKEDILIQYIDYVLHLYRSMFDAWIESRQTDDLDIRGMLEEFYKFVNEKITLNKTLSTVFIEIWEIALYNGKVRVRLQQTYREWIKALADVLSTFTDDATASRRIAIATVAFLEGMALFSVILDEDPIDFQAALNGFQENIISILTKKPAASRSVK
ncbi:MAG: TetR/AcrR family transcriptional regulator [Desulfatirhabdiaceae bacterium]|nr:TetR/AcrR family transcriptional regulator [Desulfatirhabdiaceae bacterium]